MVRTLPPKRSPVGTANRPASGGRRVGPGHADELVVERVDLGVGEARAASEQVLAEGPRHHDDHAALAADGPGEAGGGGDEGGRDPVADRLPHALRAGARVDEGALVDRLDGDAAAPRARLDGEHARGADREVVDAPGGRVDAVEREPAEITEALEQRRDRVAVAAPA